MTDQQVLESAYKILTKKNMHSFRKYVSLHLDKCKCEELILDISYGKWSINYELYREINSVFLKNIKKMEDKHLSDIEELVKDHMLYIDEKLKGFNVSSEADRKY